MSTNAGIAMQEQTEHLNRLRAERARRMKALLAEGLSVSVIQERLGLNRTFTKKKMLEQIATFAPDASGE